MGIFDIFRGEKRAERQVSFDDELLKQRCKYRQYPAV